MDDLKQAVRNASYEQKDPLIIYKFEAFELFKQMVSKINREITSFLFQSSIPIRQNDGSDAKAQEAKKQSAQNYQTSRNEQAAADKENRPQRKAQPVRVEKKVGRNEPCPCGSGKKFKKCHGKEAMTV